MVVVGVDCDVVVNGECGDIDNLGDDPTDNRGGLGGI